MNKNPPHPIDIYAGKQLRKLRRKLHLSQKQIGEALQKPISSQQIQKYECGTNRIGCSRLYEFSQILQVSPLYFLEGANLEVETIARNSPAPEKIEALLVAYESIPSAKIHDKIVQLVSCLADEMK